MAKANFYNKARQNMQNTKAKKELEFINADEDTLKGFEDINNLTMAIPFIKVLQQLSPELNKAKPTFVKEAEVGDFFNTVTKEVYGPSIEVIILKFERIYTEWLPNRGGLVNYHSPADAERVAMNPQKFGGWITNDGNSLQENYIYYLLIVGHESEGVAVISMASSGIKVAKKLNRLLVTHTLANGQRAFPYYLVWNFNTEYIENDKGNWFTITFEFKGYINEKQYNIIGPERKALPDKKLSLEAQETENIQGDAPF